MSLARVFGVFDCCRVHLSSMAGLANGRGGGNGEDWEIEDEEDAPNKYFHIQACGPNGIAAADGGFAKRLLDCCKKYGERKPVGYMSWPTDFTKVRWYPGEIIMAGGEPYTMPFGPHAKKAIEESKEPAK